MYKTFSHAVANAILPKTLQKPQWLQDLMDKRHEAHAPGTWIESILIRIMSKAKPRGQKVSIGTTDPLFGEREYEKQVRATKASARKQFPRNEKLPDGRHRYFLKNGQIIDRIKV